MIQRVTCAVLLAALAGCSAAAMQSTPLWDDDARKAPGAPEDRINLWPLFYARKPSLAVLWPLFAATEDGHALVPLYEYRRAAGQLDLLTVHPELPAAAVFSRRDEYARVLNASWDRREHAVSVFPVFHRDPERLWLLPFYYRNPSGWWSLTGLHFAGLDHGTAGWKWSWDGVLTPLLLRHVEADLTTWYALAPLLAAWRGDSEAGVRVFPWLWYARDRHDRWLNVAGPLFHRAWSRDRASTHWLWPLGAAGHARRTAWNRFLPFWWSRRHEQDSRFVSLPYFSEKSAHGQWRSWFGIVHEFHGDQDRGHALLPLYWRRAGPGRDALLATLFGGYARFGESHFADVLGPLYFQRRDPAGHYRTALFPLFHDWRSGDARGRAFLPLLTTETQPNGWGFHSPLLSFERTDSGDSFFSLGTLLFRRIHAAGQTRGDVLWPLAKFSSTQPDADVRWQRIRIFPLFSSYRRRSPDSQESSLTTPLFSTRSELHARAPLEQQVTASSQKHRFASRRILESQSYESYVTGIHRWRRITLVATPVDGASPQLEVLHSNGFSIEPLFLPVFGRSRQEGHARLYVLGALYDARELTQKDGSVQRSQRVLWKVFHRQTQGDRTSIDAFPFIAYDRTPELLQWNFFGGLVGWRARANERTLRLFFVPFPL